MGCTATKLFQGPGDRRNSYTIWERTDQSSITKFRVKTVRLCPLFGLFILTPDKWQFLQRASCSFPWTWSRWKAWSCIPARHSSHFMQQMHFKLPLVSTLSSFLIWHPLLNDLTVSWDKNIWKEKATHIHNNAAIAHLLERCAYDKIKSGQKIRSLHTLKSIWNLQHAACFNKRHDAGCLTFRQESKPAREDNI